MEASISGVAICPEELKSIVADELKELGARDIQPGYRAVSFQATEQVFYEIHLKSRTIGRILRVVKEFSAAKKEIIYDQTRRIHWDKYFRADAGLQIEAIHGDAKKADYDTGALNDKVREGIMQAFKARTGQEPKITKFEPKVQIVAFVRDRRCTLSIDTTGKNLHKRGYRDDGHPAPLKETLAAALIRWAKYDGSQVFLDPMCGSGTLAIEAAMMAINKAPLIHRKKGDFGFEWLENFNRDLWRKIQEDARAAQRTEPAQPIYASDLAAEYVSLARKNALEARVEKYIQFKTQDFLKSAAPAASGILLTNLPYGERLLDEQGAKDLFKKIGDHLKKNYAGWKACLLMPEQIPDGAIGLKATKRWKLFNGSIPVKLLMIDIYAGSQRKKPAAPKSE